MGVWLAMLLTLLVTAFAGLAYAARLVVIYVGTDILLVGWRLVRQGTRCRESPLSSALSSDQHRIVYRFTASLGAVHKALHLSKGLLACSAKSIGGRTSLSRGKMQLAKPSDGFADR